MRVGSLFSGCGGFDLGFRNAGFETVWACEVEPKPRAVFHRHFPNAEIYHDVKMLDGSSLPPVDVLIFGSPCQDLSIAGQRAGLAGEQSGLFMEAMRIVDQMAAEDRPRVAVWENVTGALSSGGGRDFGTVLGEVAKRWAGVAYRVLDLQWFGVPQRRRRVFVVGHSGGWRSAGAVLFEPQGMRWDTPARGEAGERAAALSASGVGTCGADDNQAQGGHLVSHVPGVSPTLRSASDSPAAHGKVNGTGRGTPLCVHASQTPICSYEHAHALGANSQQAVAFNLRGREDGAQVEMTDTASVRAASGGSSRSYVCAFAENQRNELRESDIAPQLQTGGGKPGRGYSAIRQDRAVRRLTPRECERLMGWPDDYTAWGVNDAGDSIELADGPRYKMIGNGVGEPHGRWIAERIMEANNDQ